MEPTVTVNTQTLGKHKGSQTSQHFYLFNFTLEIWKLKT